MKSASQQSREKSRNVRSQKAKEKRVFQNVMLQEATRGESQEATTRFDNKIIGRQTSMWWSLHNKSTND